MYNATYRGLITVMANESFKRRLIIGVFILACLALSVYRVYVVSDNIDISPSQTDPTYYLKDNMQTKIFAVMAGFMLVLSLLAAFFVSRKTNNIISNGQPLIIFASSLNGFMIIGTVFYYMFYFRTEESKSSRMVSLIIIFALVTAVYYLINASRKADTFCNPIAWLSLSPIVFFSLWLLFDFMKESTALAASSTPYLLLSLIFFILFFLTEGKSRVGKASIFLYTFFGLGGILFSLVYSIPTLLLASFWLFPTNFTLLYSLIGVSTSIYVSARLFSLKSKEDSAEEVSTYSAA